jgi:PAS domain S-box-containing protein
MTIGSSITTSAQGALPVITMQSLALLSSDFERLVVEYNTLLGEGTASGHAAADPTQREQAERRFRKRLEEFPAAIYTTDAAGRITYYNEAAVELSGRRALLGTDQWCVSWRLYWPDGRPLPHDECPMAVALKEDRAIRGAQAVAERPDGTRVLFIPHPTPLRDASGALVGAVNMLLDIGEPEQVVLDGVRVLVVAADGLIGRT